MRRFKAALTLLALAIGSHAAEPYAINWRAETDVNASTGKFAPYYIGAMRQGKVNSGQGALLDLEAWHPFDLTRRFSHEWGVEGAFRLGNHIAYDRYVSATPYGRWESISRSTSNAWLGQLYGSIKYRQVYLTAGIKDYRPALLNQRLSSGDLVESGNSRSLPGVRAGFIDFVDIPLTRGWVQIQGELAYAKSTDNDWQRQHYNEYNYHVNLGWWYNYKRMFFRTKPSEPFSVTLGMQAAAQFAGHTYYYREGLNYRVYGKPLSFMDFVHMIALEEGDAYVTGNHLGTWDFNARYRLRSGSEIKAYFQWLWEDGSGIGKLNGWDGLWGLEWKSCTPAPVSGAVLEVLTFMNQSGPMHYDYDDHTGTNMNKFRAEGADNYYNNDWYNGYALYGLGIGSPMFPQPALNTDGATTQYVHNRFWGIHAALEGNITAQVAYRVMANYRRYFGTMYIPAIEVTHSVSAFAEATWTPAALPGLALGAQLGLDCGNSIYGRNFGALISASYSGIFTTTKPHFTPCAL